MQAQFRMYITAQRRIKDQFKPAFLSFAGIPAGASDSNGGSIRPPVPASGPNFPADSAGNPPQSVSNPPHTLFSDKPTANAFTLLAAQASIFGRFYVCHRNSLRAFYPTSVALNSRN